MLTVDDFARIRRAACEGMSIREMARRFGHSRKSIRKALANGEPTPYTLTQPREAPVLGGYHGVIGQILADDQDAPPKQRHTAAQIYRRLRDEQGYPGSYAQVRRYVAKQRRLKRPTFIPLAHEPGRRLESDFGHIEVDYPEGRRQVPVFIATWSYSHARFAMAMPTERTEAVLEGLTQALAFFGCVPQELWWDNPKTIATQILQGRSRQWNGRYAAFVSHYAIEPCACMPASGWEKPAVEHSVYDLQRRWATPVPRVRDNDELNAYLRECCLAEMDRTVAGQTETIGQRFDQDKAAAGALPKQPFDPCVYQTVKVDKYQTAAFDTNRYSVPRRYAFETVTIKAYVDRVEFVARDTVIARHERSYQRHEWVLDPIHYLVTLGRRPAALDHAPVYRDWKLPAVFGQLRQQLEARHGSTRGARQFIRVLQLLVEHPVGRVQQAIEQTHDVVDVDRILQRVQRLAQRGADHEATDLNRFNHQRDVIDPQVPVPDLNQFNQLLTSRSQPHAPSDESPNRTAPRTPLAQDEPQAATPAEDQCRVCQAVPRSRLRQADLRAIPLGLDRVGSGSPISQCDPITDQTGGVPGAQGAG